MLAKNPKLVEKLSGITHVLVDKTGVMTQPDMTVTNLWADGDIDLQNRFTWLDIEKSTG